MRHGQSFWNKKNLFTGWVDIPLTEEGIQEAMEGGKRIKDIPIDVIFTSALVRAQMSAFVAMLHHSSKKIPVLVSHEKKMQNWGKIHDKQAKSTIIPMYHSWHLNERMYGNLQGLDKEKLRQKYGKEQVQIWRRSYRQAPPEGESLKMTSERTLPYFTKEIVPYLDKGKNVFISAHGNSLRSIIMHLEKLDEEQIVHLEIATAAPVVYSYHQKVWEKIL